MSPSKLRRIQPGEYENEVWYVKRETEDDSADYDFKATATHPLTGHTYVPAPVFSWFVWHKESGDFHDAYPTLREARRFVEAARKASA